MQPMQKYGRSFGEELTTNLLCKELNLPYVGVEELVALHDVIALEMLDKKGFREAASDGINRTLQKLRKISREDAHALCARTYKKSRESVERFKAKQR